MIRIYLENTDLVMTLDTREEIDEAIEALETGRYDGIGPSTTGGILRFLDQRDPEGLTNNLKRVRAFKETDGESYPALAAWFDDKVHPEYTDVITDHYLRLAKSMRKVPKAK